MVEVSEAIDSERVTLRRVGVQCCVVTPYGEVDAYRAPVLRGKLTSAFSEAGMSVLVVDLSRTTFVDSSALGVLVGGLKRARERNGRFVVVAPTGGVRRILEITSLDCVFEIHETLDGALAA
jgi:anti-sigma B factor antagonist